MITNTMEDKHKVRSVKQGLCVTAMARLALAQLSSEKVDSELSHISDAVTRIARDRLRPDLDREERKGLDLFEDSGETRPDSTDRSQVIIIVRFWY